MSKSLEQRLAALDDIVLSDRRLWGFPFVDSIALLKGLNRREKEGKLFARIETVELCIRRKAFAIVAKEKELGHCGWGKVSRQFDALPKSTKDIVTQQIEGQKIFSGPSLYALINLQAGMKQAIGGKVSQLVAILRPHFG